MKAKSRQIKKVDILKFRLFGKHPCKYYMHYIKLLSFLNPSGCSPCRKWNNAKSVKQKDQIFNHHQNARSINDICMIKRLKIQATIDKEVFQTIITSLGTSCGKGCRFTIILYTSSWTDFFETVQICKNLY